MDNNPLRQYFRRPSVYIKLPSGGIGYSPDDLMIPESGELPVYPMTAIDEITIRTPDALFNGTAIAELIKSCIPNIKNPWAVTSNDMDAILIGIKAASGSETLDIDSMCPSCEEVSSYGVNLVSTLSTLKSGDYESVMEIKDFHIKFRPLTFKELNEAGLKQFELQKLIKSLNTEPDLDQRDKTGYEIVERVTLLTMELVAASIEYVKTDTIVVKDQEFILDFLKNCDKLIYNAIRDRNAELKSGTELKPLQVTCPSCSHEYEQSFTLNPADFFE
jgi:hypothetical protein